MASGQGRIVQGQERARKGEGKGRGGSQPLNARDQSPQRQGQEGAVTGEGGGGRHKKGERQQKNIDC